MAELRAVLTATDTELVWAELTARAQAEHIRRGDHGLHQPGLDALRADAVLGQDTDAGPEATDADASSGKAGGQSEGSSRVQLRVSVDLPTLLGLAENPAELAGHGPIPPQLARELAGDADWTRLTTYPQTGELLDLAPHRYRPSRRLAAFIRARQPVCTWPAATSPPNAATSTTTRTSAPAGTPADATSALSADSTTTPKRPRPMALPAPPRPRRHPHQPTRQDLHTQTTMAPREPVS
jgi:hypothetical protein